MAYSLVLINIIFTAYSLVLAEVVLYSLYSLVSVKKDSPSIGILDSYQVLGSTILVIGSHLNHLQVAGILVQSLISRLYFYKHISIGLISLGSSIVLVTNLGL